MEIKIFWNAYFDAIRLTGLIIFALVKNWYKIDNNIHVLMKLNLQESYGRDADDCKTTSDATTNKNKPPAIL